MKNGKWKLNANFLFQTGQPATFPNGQYQYNGVTIPSYSSRNADRLPVYNRLDLSATYTSKPEKKSGLQSYWVFGVYNAYNRKNAASISFSSNKDTGANEASRLAIFGVIPSVSYNFKF